MRESLWYVFIDYQGRDISPDRAYAAKEFIILEVQILGSNEMKTETD